MEANRIRLGAYFRFRVAFGLHIQFIYVLLHLKKGATGPRSHLTQA